MSRRSKELVTGAGVLALFAALFVLGAHVEVQGPWTSPPGTNGKLRIVSTAADALCIGGSLVAPTASQCTGGLFGGTLVGATVNATSGYQINGLTAFKTSDFRGLQLRTNPDASLADRQVWFNADEILMEDGARFQNWTGQTADITVAGAGGLDTGAEAANVWYEVYAIAKDDGTRSAVLHRAKNYNTNQIFTTATDTSRALRLATATATDKVAQGVTPSATAVVSDVNLVIQRTGAPVGNVWVTLEADTAGNPSGTPLATSDKLPITNTTTAVGGQYVMFIFRTPPTLSNGVQYHIVLQGDYTRSDANYIGWLGVVAGGYAGGASREFNGTTWAATAGANGLDRDFQFQIVQNDAAVTMPAGYTRKCKIGYVFNNGSSNFNAFAAKDRKVRHGVVTVIASAITTVYALAQPASIMPPGFVGLLLGANNNTSGQTFAVRPVGPEYDAAYNIYVFAVAATGSAGSQIGVAGEILFTEYQSFYYAVSANQGDLFSYGFEW